MIEIIKRVLNNRKMSLFAFSLFSICFLIIYAAVFPTVEKQAQAFQDLLSNLPQTYLKAFGVSSVNFTEFGSYLGVEYFSIIWQLLVIIFSMSLASNLIAGEIESGTIVLSLSLPISRVKIYLAKYISSIIYLLLFVTFSILSIIPIAAINNISISSNNVFTLGVLCFLFGLSILSIGFFISSMVSTKGLVNMVMSGILLTMYMLNIIASLTDKLENLKYFSFFYYFNPSEVVKGNSIMNSSIAIFLGVAILFSLMGMIIFKKRDIIA